MSATLGGLIKDYRLQNNLSQQDVAFAIGWKESSRLSRIEQGKVQKPSRDLIDKIIEVLNLDIDEKNNILLAGGYLPKNEEMDRAKNKAKDVIDKWNYPSFLLDFAWRSVYFNSKAQKVYDLSNKNLKNDISNKYPNVIEFIFSPYFIQNRTLKGKEKDQWHMFLKNTLIHFKYQQKPRNKDKWYTELIKKMMENNLFRQLWKESSNTNPMGVATNRGKKIFVDYKDKNNRLEFDFFLVPMLNNPRFNIEYHTPTNKKTMERFK